MAAIVAGATASFHGEGDDGAPTTETGVPGGAGGCALPSASPAHLSTDTRHLRTLWLSGQSLQSTVGVCARGSALLCGCSRRGARGRPSRVSSCAGADCPVPGRECRGGVGASESGAVPGREVGEEAERGSAGYMKERAMLWMGEMSCVVGEGVGAMCRYEQWSP